MENRVDRFGATLKKLAGIVAVAFGTAALINFGKESVKLASDIEEFQNVIDVTFGQGAKEIEDFAKSAAEAFGLSELAAKQYSGTMGAMLKSSGIATDAAKEMSIALSGLAGDIASFYNLDTDTAFEKIRSGISGETEPLKQLGINMSVANLEAYALSKGITKSYNAMYQAEQVLLRYNYLLSVTTDAQGDFARASVSFANQIRILQLNFNQLKIAVGNAIIPIAQAVLPGINAIISALTKLATVFAKVTAMLFGKKVSSGSSGQVKEQEAIASSGMAAAGATDKLADATAGAGEASKKAAKDMKGVLAGFDELNILADSAAESLGSAAGGIGDVGSDDVNIPALEDMDGGAILEIGESFKSLGEIFRDTLDDMLSGIPRLREAFLNFADSFNDFNKTLYDAFKFDGVLERVELLGQELARAFNDLVNAIDWELWGRTLGAGMNLGLQFLTEFIYTFDWINLGQKLSDLVNGIVYEVDWYDFGRLMWTQFKIGLETFAGFFTGLDMPALAQAANNIVKGFFDSMQETISNIEWGEIGRQIADFLNNIDWLIIITSISGALESMVAAGLELVAGFISNADPEVLVGAAAILFALFGSKIIGTVITPVAREIAHNLISKVAEAITSSGITTMLSGIGTAILGIGSVIAGVVLAASAFFSMWNDGFSWAKEAVMLVGIALAAVGAVLLGVPAAVAAIVAAIVAVVATAAVVIHEHWDEIKEAAVNAWEAIKEAWNAAGEWFNENVITPVVEVFTGLWEEIKRLTSEAWETVKSTWDTAAQWFSTTVVEPVKKFFSELWENVKKTASDAWAAVKNAWNAASEWFRSTITEPIAKFFSEAWEKIKTSASEAWNSVKTGIQNFWSELKSWWSSNAGKYFTSEYWKDLGKRMINGLLDGLRNIFSDLSSWASDVWGSITSAFSVKKAKSSISGGMNYAPRMTTVEYSAYSARNLPHLANGAVIPPNQQFAAILGDQRNGYNIEAPADLIRQMVMEGIRAAGGVGGNSGNMTIVMEIDGREFGRASYKYGTAERQRVGVRLTEVRA